MARKKTEEPTRFCFEADDDGHTYLIPVSEKEAFNKWLDAAPYWENYKGEDYSAAEIGSSPSLFSFTDPRLD